MRILAGILSAGLIAGITTAASAQTDGWYAGAETGLNIAPTVKFRDGSHTWQTSQDLGYSILGQVGYGFGPVRVEGELGWRSNDINKLKQPALGNGDGSLDAASVFGNAYYDIATGTQFTPYIGAGVGGVDIEGNKVRASGITFTKKSDFVFGYQGIAGVGYTVNDNLALKLDYHYMRTVDAKLEEDPSWGNGKGKGQYVANTILVGFTYKFGAPKPAPAAAPAPMAAPVPAPAPAPKAVQAAPIAKNFIVFFDFNKADITPEANRIITQAVAAAKSSNATTVSLVGHTDAAGSDKYNLALSLKRANAVKAALVKQGIPTNAISVLGKGKSEPLVPTKDGVREPQNRRVQILLP